MPFFGLALALLGVWLLAACRKADPSMEDAAGGRQAEEFGDVAEDVFKAMDGGIQLGSDEVRGRNMWNLWTGGDEQFWDRMARESHGLTDLLKTIDSRRRGVRFQEMGLINEPGLRQASKPDEFGLWIDEHVDQDLPGIDPEVYGRSTGVMGFRLFPNPAFDAAARQAWNAERYYRDADYAASPTLVRPYRVGISCGSCHIGFHPLNPPTDPENPRWENLASAIGNQYLREGRVFAGGAQPGGFFAEMLQAQPPGTSDNSRIVTDHLNNPGSINPIFLWGAREATAQQEFMHPDFMLLPNQRQEMKVPRQLHDGADCVDLPGATLRAYVNMGMYSQHWLQQHNPLIGLTPQKPFSIKAGRKYSAYWNSTESRLGSIARFFRRIAPMHLADAPGGQGFIDHTKVPRGRTVFAENCAICHSSKHPSEGLEEKEWFMREIERPEFLADNFFGNEKRYAVNDIKTNAARACASNAMRGHIWDVFSSETYKSFGSVGGIEVWNPYTGKDETFILPKGGPGFYRPPSLLSLWTSAPFLHHNVLGKFTGDPSVKGRLEAFDDAIEKLLWPEKRAGRDSIWRTSQPCMLQLPGGAIPDPLHTLLQPHFDADGAFRVGPIPAGTPINLFANVNPETPPIALTEIFVHIKKVLAEAQAKGLDAAAMQEVMKTEVAPRLFKVSKCPDLVEDRGHTYGAELSDDDKRALIEFLKTI